MSSFDFLECVLAPERPTVQQHIPSDGYLISGESFRNFNSKMSINGLPPLTIPGKKGGYVDVLIDNIESTENFFCHLQDQVDVITKMSDDIEKFYSDNLSGSKPLVNAIPGTLCAARYSGDDCWYRGFILNRPRPAVFEIYFVDFGNTEMIYLTDLRTLSRDFSKYPPRAFRCALKNVPNNQCTIRKFKEKTEGQKLVLKLEDVERNVFAVTLFDFDPATKQEMNINDFLNVAIHHENNVGLKNELTNGNTKENEINQERVPNEISRPEFEDYIVSPNKMETFPDADWPTIMPICEVFISYGFRPDELFIQKFDTIEEFVNFTERLQKIYKMCPKVKGNNVKIGSPYAAVSVDNGKFYRCVPVEILDDGSVKVQFVDLGICQIMPAYDLHTFPDDDFCSEFLSTGRYVVKAYLIGSQPEKSAGGYSGKVVTFADNYTMTENGSPKKFICKIDRSSVTKNGQSYAVELFYEDDCSLELLRSLSTMMSSHSVTPVNMTHVSNPYISSANSVHTQLLKKGQWPCMTNIGQEQELVLVQKIMSSENVMTIDIRDYLVTEFRITCVPDLLLQGCNVDITPSSNYIGGWAKIIISKLQQLYHDQIIELIHKRVQDFDALRRQTRKCFMEPSYANRGQHCKIWKSRIFKGDLELPEFMDNWHYHDADCAISHGIKVLARHAVMWHIHLRHDIFRLLTGPLIRNPYLVYDKFKSNNIRLITEDASMATVYEFMCGYLTTTRGYNPRENWSLENAYNYLIRQLRNLLSNWASWKKNIEARRRADKLAAIARRRGFPASDDIFF